MNKYIIAILFVTLTGNTVFAADSLELSDTLKSAFEAKLLAENGMQRNIVKPSAESEVKGPACACESGNLKEITKNTVQNSKKTEDNKETTEKTDEKNNMHQ